MRRQPPLNAAAVGSQPRAAFPHADGTAVKTDARDACENTGMRAGIGVSSGRCGGTKICAGTNKYSRMPAAAALCRDRNAAEKNNNHIEKTIRVW